jgi:hypothetical protein
MVNISGQHKVVLVLYQIKQVLIDPRRNHCKGFRLMTLGWTDGNTFLPVNSCLLASSKERNLIGPVDQSDGRSLAAKHGKLAQTKGTEVKIELLKTARNAGHHADKYLLLVMTNYDILGMSRSSLIKLILHERSAGRSVLRLFTLYAIKTG